MIVLSVVIIVNARIGEANGLKCINKIRRCWLWI